MSNIRNLYACFYDQKYCEVRADTSYEAQEKAAEKFNLQRRTWQISVALLEKNGVPVVHKTSEI